MSNVVFCGAREKFDNNYLKNFLYIHKESKSQASFVFYNSSLGREDIAGFLGDKYTVVDNLDPQGTCQVMFLDEKTPIAERLENVLKVRSKVFNTQNIYVVIEKPEDFRIENLEKLMTIARSRNIYFVLVVEDKEAFKKTYTPEGVISIVANCEYTCHWFAIEQKFIDDPKHYNPFE